MFRLVQYGSLWSHVVPRGPVWSRMDLCGPVWSHVVPCGPMWSRMVPYCSICWKCDDPNKDKFCLEKYHQDRYHLSKRIKQTFH